MSTVCGKCQRPLKNPKSMERGYGPECWGKISKVRKAEDDRDQAMRSDFTYHTREVNGTSVKEVDMSYFWTCEVCGASLDPGEKCDCSKEQQKTPEPAETKGEEECKKTA